MTKRPNANLSTPTPSWSSGSSRPSRTRGVLCDLAELFKVFGDSSRIKLLQLLMEGELCVCDMAQLLGMSQSAVSHQLRVLKAADLVKFRREGKAVFYSLADEHVRTIISNGMEHVLE